MTVLDYAESERRECNWGWARYVAVGGLWGAVVLGPGWMLLVPLAVVGMGVLIWKRWWRSVAVAVVFSPMAVSAVAGVGAYWCGKGVIVGNGLVREDPNVDPVTRLQFASMGCVVSGNEWMTHGPFDVAVLGMRACFGVMPGAYDGPYPDEAAAYKEIARGKVLDLRDMETGTMVVDGVKVVLRPGLGKAILAGFSEGPATDVGNVDLLKEYGEAHGVVVGGRCVIIEVPQVVPGTLRRGGGGIGEHRVLFLIDARSGKCFARYADRRVGTFRMRFGTIWR